MDDSQSEEMKRRIKQLPQLANCMGAYFTLGRLSRDAMRRTKADKVDWDQVHKDVIFESIGEHGQSPHEVLDALTLYSPGAVTEEQQNSLKATVNGIKHDLTVRYREVRSKEDDEYQQTREVELRYK